MKNKYNIWNKWNPLKVVMLGDTYGVEFFRDIKNDRIRSALCRITDETKEEILEEIKTLAETCNKVCLSLMLRGK